MRPPQRNDGATRALAAASLSRLIAPSVLIVLLVVVNLGALPSWQQNTTAANTSTPTTNNENHSFNTKQLSNLLAQQPVDQSVSSVYQELPNGGNSASLSSVMLKSYIRTNNMRAYHLDLHSYRPDAKFIGDPNFVQSENPAHQQKCAAHLSQFEQMLKSFSQLDPVLAKNSLESLRLADTFGRPEAGALLGNQFWLGSYEQCLDFSVAAQQQKPADITTTIKGHYCLGISQFPNWNPQHSKTSIKIGLCLPETCTSSMINENGELLDKVETMMKYQFGKGQPYSRLKLREVYCLPHETSEVRRYSQSAIAFLVFIGMFVSACLIATTIDYLNTKLPENQLKSRGVVERNWRTIVVESFSITRNLQKFFHINHADDNSKQQQVQPVGSFDRQIFLDSTTGLKCIGLIWIICAHTFLVAPITSNNLIGFDNLTKTYLANIYLTAHLMVDTFFALSGLLASYFLFKGGMDAFNSRQWLVLTIHRYWRLTPIYLICYWFTKSVGFLTNSGPMWDYMTAEQSPRLNCARESWSHALLHLSDFKSPKDHCVPFAWFIANGIKFWMVTPIFLILIHKSVRHGYMLTMSTIMANIALVGILAMQSNVDMKSVIEFKPESADNMLNNMGQVYTRPYSRIGTYLIGLLAGHLMYLVDTNQLQVKLSKNAKIIIWTMFSITVIVMTFVLKIANGVEIEEAAIPWVFSISAALIRPLWAVCTCWIIFAMAHGQVRWISRFLGANIWRTLVKLSFCGYLVQGEVIAQLYLATTHSDRFTYVDMIARPIVTTMLTMAASLVMVLILEYPLIGIEEIILPRRQKTSTPKSADDVKTHGEKLKST